ncbi:hypothetical protein HPP92_001751 [Vanilla planifolia]|uniref:Uncharacterized protein n=1 Tax=Vanilla planifolia TaxID=51239 RepID=A0A835S0C6_VANPL|nr:hypothetical protein HPP92_001751 [Vanilla planifolia]
MMSVVLFHYSLVSWWILPPISVARTSHLCWCKVSPFWFFFQDSMAAKSELCPLLGEEEDFC